MRSSTTCGSRPPLAPPSSPIKVNGEVVSTPLKSNSTASIATARPYLVTGQAAVGAVFGTGGEGRVAAAVGVVADRLGARLEDVRVIRRPLPELVALALVRLHHH